MNKFLIQKIKFHAIIGSIICAIIAYSGYMIHINFNKNHLLILQIEKTLNDITYYDEVLTMSARMAAFTGDKAWENRYRVNEVKLDEAIKLTYSIFPKDSENIETKITDEANFKLVEMENKAFQLVDEGHFSEARKILVSPAYYEQKNLYSLGQQKLSEKLRKYEKELDSRHLAIIITIISVCCLFIALSIVLIFLNFKTIQKSYEQEKRTHEYKRLAITGKLSAGMAHEINNALLPILGLSEILHKAFMKNGSEHAQFSEYTKIIHTSANHAKEIVENVLASAKGIQSQMGQWDVLELLNYSLSLALKILPDTIDVKSDLSNIQNIPSDYKIIANRTDITQTISNILKNAAQAMNDRGTIIISTELALLNKDNAIKYGVYEGRYIQLMIEDKGCGIDDRTISNIFDPFFTTKSEQNGTGLGLSVAYGIMKQIGGNIHVRSKVNKGTTFTLFFPLQE